MLFVLRLALDWVWDLCLCLGRWGGVSVAGIGWGLFGGRIGDRYIWQKMGDLRMGKLEIA